MNPWRELSGDSGDHVHDARRGGQEAYRAEEDVSSAYGMPAVAGAGNGDRASSATMPWGSRGVVRGDQYVPRAARNTPFPRASVLGREAGSLSSRGRPGQRPLPQTAFGSRASANTRHGRRRLSDPRGLSRSALMSAGSPRVTHNQAFYATPRTRPDGAVTPLFLPETPFPPLAPVDRNEVAPQSNLERVENEVEAPQHSGNFEVAPQATVVPPTGGSESPHPSAKQSMKTFLDELNASLGNSLRELSTSMHSLQAEVADLRKAKETQEARPTVSRDASSGLMHTRHSVPSETGILQPTTASDQRQKSAGCQISKGLSSAPGLSSHSSGRRLQSRDMPLSDFSGSTNQSLEAWIRMASIKQRREGLSDEDICAAAAFKLRGDAQTYFHLNEAEMEDYSLESLAKILRRRFDSKSLSQRAVPDLWRTKQRTDETASAFEMRWKLAVERARRAEPALVTDEFLFLAFQSCLNQTFSDRIFDAKCSTYREAMEEFHRYGMRQDEDTGPKLPGIFAVNTWSPKEKVARPAQAATHCAPEGRKDSGPSTGLSHERPPLECWQCGGPHMRRNCPDRRDNQNTGPKGKGSPQNGMRGTGHANSSYGGWGPMPPHMAPPASWMHTAYGPVYGIPPMAMPQYSGVQYPGVATPRELGTNETAPAVAKQPDSRVEHENTSGKASKGTQAKVRAVSTRHPLLYIVKCEAGLGTDSQHVLVDSCAPANLIDMDLVETMKVQGLARNTSFRRYAPDMTLVGISGQKLRTAEEVEVDLTLGGVPVTHNFIPVRDFSDKLLLSVDFLDAFDGNISFRDKAVVFEKLGVTLPMMGYWRKVKGSLSKAVLFCQEPVVIPPLSELPITVMHMGTDPLSLVSRDGYVCDRADAVRPTCLRVCPGVVRFERGIGSLVVANMGDSPLHLDSASAVADVVPVNEKGSDIDIGQGKSIGVFRVNVRENEHDLSADKVSVLASLALKEGKSHMAEHGIELDSSSTQVEVEKSSLTAHDKCF